MIGLGFCFEDPLESLPLSVIFTCLSTSFSSVIAKVSADSQGLRIFFLVPMTSTAVSQMVELTEFQQSSTSSGRSPSRSNLFCMYDDVILLLQR